MATKIFVENLPFDITEDMLKDIFAQIGDVESVKIQTDLITHRPKGSGYVEMSLDVDAYRAVHCFNGATLKDKKIYLKEAKPFYERAKDMLRQRVSMLAQQVTADKRCPRNPH
ncbi:MAG: RNA recognition motif domain-containing protein [Betaproteobacteria bacterium]